MLPVFVSGSPAAPDAAQVNSDWNAVSGAAQILNKPALVTLPITESNVTGLVADLALKAPLASPTFTGTAAFANITVSGTTSFAAASIAQAAVSGLVSGLALLAPLASPAFTGASTASGNWSWVNATVATVTTTNASPTQTLSANFWTGAASSADTWVLGSSLLAGANGASTLAITHSGSTGTALVQVPKLNVATASNAGLINLGTDGVVNLWRNANNHLVLNAGTFIDLTVAGPVTIGATDTGISRAAAGSIAVGNGTPGDASGKLTAATITGTIIEGTQLAAGSGGGVLSVSNVNGLIYAGTSVWSDTVVYAMGVVAASHFMGIGSSSMIRFSSTTAYNGTADLGLSRSAVGVLAVGNGAQGDTSGTLTAAILNATTGFQIAGAATSGRVLRANGTNFVSAQLAYSDLSGTPTQTLAAETDVTITSPANNDVLTYETSSSKWKNKPASGGGSSVPVGALPWFDVTPPASPSVWDDEFNSSTLNAKWTANSYSNYVDINTTIPSMFYSETYAGGDYNWVRQPFVPGTADFTVLAKYHCHPQSNSYDSMYILISDSTINTNYMFQEFGSRSGNTMTVFAQGAQPAQVGLAECNTMYVYLQRWNSASSARWTYWYSYDGIVWNLLLDSYGNTLTVNYLQLVSGGQSSAVFKTHACDYVRVNHNLNLRVNPTGSFSSTARL